MDFWQVAKSLTSINLYGEEDALLFVTLTLFTSFLKCCQILSKGEREKNEHRHECFFQNC